MQSIFLCQNWSEHSPKSRRVRPSLHVDGVPTPDCKQLIINFIPDYQHVKLKGLYGTYDHALEWLKSPKISAKPKTILWLGSSLGNFTRADVPPFLKGFRAALQPGDSMLIGIDSCKEPERVFSEYGLD
jgi:uncharacterized SAM-dependent methyltransferase